MRPAPPVVIQKFNGDPMQYWLFVRQFDVRVLQKVEDYELFPLLHQYCDSHVQFTFSYVSNQSPVIAFPDDDKISLNHRLNFSKCCASLKHIEPSFECRFDACDYGRC